MKLDDLAAKLIKLDNDINLVPHPDLIGTTIYQELKIGKQLRRIQISCSL